MKKIIAIVLSAIMLMSVMALGVFAESFSFNDLEEFGQQNWVIEGKTDVPPIADGIVEEGEYTLAIKDMDPFDDEADDRFFCIDPSALDVENFSVYFSYDDDYIYIAAEITEPETLDGESISFRIYSNAHNAREGIVIQYKYGGVPDTSEAEAFCAEKDGDLVTYELIIRRTLLSDYIGADDVDDVKEFFLLICMSDDRDTVNYPYHWPEMWVGCKVPKGFESIASSAENAEAEDKIYGYGPDNNRLPHKMTLGEAPVVETEPEETVPADTTPADTTPVESNNVESEPVAENPISGCSLSIAAVAVALVASLGTCVALVAKKR